MSVGVALYKINKDDVSYILGASSKLKLSEIEAAEYDKEYQELYDELRFKAYEKKIHFNNTLEQFDWISEQMKGTKFEDDYYSDNKDHEYIKLIDYKIKKSKKDKKFINEVYSNCKQYIKTLDYQNKKVDYIVLDEITWSWRQGWWFKSKFFKLVNTKYRTMRKDIAIKYMKTLFDFKEEDALEAYNAIRYHLNKLNDYDFIFEISW